MEYTSNLNFKLPQGSDPVHISDINDNMEIVDDALTAHTQQLSFTHAIIYYQGNDATTMELTFPFAPRMLMIQSVTQSSRGLLPIALKDGVECQGRAQGTSTSGRYTVTATLSGQTVSFWGSDLDFCINVDYPGQNEYVAIAWGWPEEPPDYE